jgi:hypothetical protein
VKSDPGAESGNLYILDDYIVIAVIEDPAASELGISLSDTLANGSAPRQCEAIAVNSNAIGAEDNAVLIGATVKGSGEIVVSPFNIGAVVAACYLDGAIRYTVSAGRLPRHSSHTYHQSKCHYQRR